MNNFFQFLGLASRAQACVTGEDFILTHVRNKKAKLVIIADDASENTKKRYIDKCNYYQVKWILYGDTLSISQALGKVNRVAVAICDDGFAKGLLAKRTNKE